MFYPTWVDVGIFVGSIGLFFTMFLLFLRVLPPVAIAEVKLLLKSQSHEAKRDLIREGHQKPAEIDNYRDALGKYDSISDREIKELVK